MNAARLLSVRDLTLTIPTDRGPARILDSTSLDLGAGEIMGLVGESGCGKSTLAKACLGLTAPGAKIESGQISVDGIDVLTASEGELENDVRGRRIAFVPQDPALSFNPVFTVGSQLFEIMRGYDLPGDNSSEARRGHLLETLASVRIASPEHVLDRYPHEFSGGQRQRLMIAGALLCSPKLIVADEPTSALDVTTQQRILSLLRELARGRGVAMLFVTHDFGIVSELCDSVTVMYAGQTIERAPTRDLIDRPRHPYSRMLIDCHPDRGGALSGIQGMVPPATSMPSGCRFHPRCPKVEQLCSTTRPLLSAIEAEARSVACHVVMRALAGGPDAG